ncbi:MAG: hypothetical protein ACI4W6_02550 [Acutalibacteraceae bacterium]
MNRKNAFILIVTIAMMICFSACGKTETEEPSEPITVSSPAISTTASAPVATTDPVTVPTTASTTAQTTAQTVVDPMRVFNDAAAISVPVSATYDRTAVTGSFESGNNRFDSFLNSFIGEETLTPQNGASLPAAVSALSALTADCIASSDITDNGTSWSLTFNLQDTQVPSGDKPSKGGYVFYMDGNEAMTAIQKANDQIFMKNEGTIRLSDGILTATVDKSSGKLTSVQLRCKEVYQDNIDLSKFDIPSMMASLIPDSVSATFEYDLTVNCTF